ncbi:MAG: amidohydrolase [Clostridiaceae bacterium]|nr:amidohydrolase [Clostridiaceae bacterium]
MGKKEVISRLVDKYSGDMKKVNDTVWEYAEPGMKEYKTAKFYESFFAEKGFKVESGMADMPTAFVASWGEGKPVVGFLGEFDALPTLSQEASCAVKKPIVEGAYGQGCGHNCLGAAAAGAALAYRDYLEESGLKGTVRFYGCPGEEYGSGKVFMARDGLFDDVDICLTWHPGDMNKVSTSSSLANISVMFTFKGVSAHAAANPHLGRSALDAVELMNVGVNYLREHIIPEARVHYAYVNAGGIAPNVVHDSATIHYFIRAPKMTQAQEVFERVKDVAWGAAKMTGTTHTVNLKEAIFDYNPNRTLESVMQNAFEQIGAPEFDEDDFKLAHKFRESFTKADIEDTKSSLAAMGQDPELISLSDELHCSVLPYVPINRAMPGSTDVGDASYCAPTAQVNVSTMALGTPGHSWQITAQSCSSLADKGALTAAKVMALTAAMAAEDEALLKRAKAELKKTTGGKYVSAVPPEIKPNI